MDDGGVRMLNDVKYILELKKQLYVFRYSKEK